MTKRISKKEKEKIKAEVKVWMSNPENIKALKAKLKAAENLTGKFCTTYIPEVHDLNKPFTI